MHSYYLSIFWSKFLQNRTKSNKVVSLASTWNKYAQGVQDVMRGNEKQKWVVFFFFIFWRWGVLNNSYVLMVAFHSWCTQRKFGLRVYINSWVIKNQMDFKGLLGWWWFIENNKLIFKKTFLKFNVCLNWKCFSRKPKLIL